MISQSEFTNGLEFLINEGIIYIPSTEPGIPGPDKIIPDWVRNTAGWWADNKIPDSEFINAMKYLIEVGIIDVEVSSPEILEEQIIAQLPEDSTIIGKPLNMVLEGYRTATADGKFVLDIKIFNADKYSGTNFGGNFDYVIEGVNVDISLFNEEGLIDTFSDTTSGSGIIRYSIMAKETTQDTGLWIVNNLYTVNIIATLDDQTVEKNYEFLGGMSAHAYNTGPTNPAPGDITTTAGDDKMTLEWTAPHGAPGISDYRIEYSLNFGTDGADNDGDGTADEYDERSLRKWQTFSHEPADIVGCNAITIHRPTSEGGNYIIVVCDADLSDVVDSLADSTTYYFRVAAEYPSGTGKYSSEVIATTT